METVRMYDNGAIYDIDIDASEEQIEAIKEEFDMGNSSIFSFERLIEVKGYRYNTNQVGGKRRCGFFE